MNIRELSLDWSFLSDEVHIPLPESKNPLQLLIKDQKGDTVLEKVLEKRSRHFMVRDLPEGKYFFEVRCEGAIVKQGTFIK